MRCYYDPVSCDIQLDKTRYQQFLREQELSEYDISHLNIHFVPEFTCTHFKGCVDLAPGGAYFQRGREYVEQENKQTLAFYRPYDPPDCKYAAIFLRLARGYSLEHLNSTFLHETRHHIQHCRNLPCCSAVSAGIENEAFRSRNQPWEIDAEGFARKHAYRVCFLLPVSHPLKRSDLQW